MRLWFIYAIQKTISEVFSTTSSCEQCETLRCKYNEACDSLVVTHRSTFQVIWFFKFVLTKIWASINQGEQRNNKYFVRNLYKNLKISTSRLFSKNYFRNSIKNYVWYDSEKIRIIKDFFFQNFNHGIWRELHIYKNVWILNINYTKYFSKMWRFVNFINSK